MNKVKLQYKEELVRRWGEPTTIDELFEMTRNELEYQLGKVYQPRGKQSSSAVVTGFAWTINYRKDVSNSHAAPANGVTNWAGRNEAPTSYPGFTGRVWIRISEKPKKVFSISDVFNHTLTYPGTGGAGSYDGPWKDIMVARYNAGLCDAKSANDYKVHSYSWDYKIFTSDFPLIIDTWVKHNLFNTIKTNKSELKINSSKVWTDPETEQADKDFLTQSYLETIPASLIADKLNPKERFSYA